MELIQIIYNVLLFGGGFVILLMIILYVLSKSKVHELPHKRVRENLAVSDQLIRSRVNYQNQIASILPSNQLQWEQSEIRTKSLQPRPQIFPIDQTQQREVKIVRKPTVKGEAKTRTMDDRNSNGRRYTIVNEEQKRAGSRAINFYL